MNKSENIERLVLSVSIKRSIDRSRVEGAIAIYLLVTILTGRHHTILEIQI